MEEILNQILDKLNNMDSEIKNGFSKVNERIDKLENKVDNLETNMDNKFEMVNGKLLSIEQGNVTGFQTTLNNFNEISKKLDRQTVKIEKLSAITKDIEYRVEDLEAQKV